MYQNTAVIWGLFGVPHERSSVQRGTSTYDLKYLSTFDKPIEIFSREACSQFYRWQLRQKMRGCEAVSSTDVHNFVWRSLCPTVLLTFQMSKAFGNRQNLSAGIFWLILCQILTGQESKPQIISIFRTGLAVLKLLIIWGLDSYWMRHRSEKGKGGVMVSDLFLLFRGIFCAFIGLLISTASPALSSTEISKTNVCIYNENANEGPP